MLLGIVVWLAVVGAGMSRLMHYESTAGAGSNAPEHWPTDSRLARRNGESILLMFVHPKCPCSRASLDQLADLLRALPQRVQARVVFCRPAGFSDAENKTNLWDQAKSIPDVVVVCGEPEEATRFGVFTSGQVLFYDERGILRFRGGITRARGVGGAGESSNALFSAVLHQSDAVAEAPVFGCPLFDVEEGTPRTCCKRPMK
jgi:hypothetical protein